MNLRQTYFRCLPLWMLISLNAIGLVACALPVQAQDLKTTVTAACTTAADCAGTMQSAINSLPATGGVIDLPAGSFHFSGITIANKLVTIRGGGAAPNNSGQRGATRLTYTGNGVAISISGTAATGSHLIGFLLDNGGSGTVGIDIDNTDDIGLQDVVLAIPARPWSEAGIRVGNAGLVVGANLDRVSARGNPINLEILKSNSLTCRTCRFAMATKANVIVGGPAKEAINTTFLDGQFEEVPNVDSVVLIRARGFLMLNPYFEISGSAVALHIPSTAALVSAAQILGGHISAVYSGAVYATDVDLPSADFRIDGTEMSGFHSPHYLIHNEKSASVIAIGNRSISSGTFHVADNLSNATSLGNVSLSGAVVDNAVNGPFARPIVVKAQGTNQAAFGYPSGNIDIAVGNPDAYSYRTELGYNWSNNHGRIGVLGANASSFGILDVNASIVEFGNSKVRVILPTSCSGQSSGTLYNRSGVVAICP